MNNFVFFLILFLFLLSSPGCGGSSGSNEDIEDTNTAPTAEITSPVNGEDLKAGNTVILKGIGSDAEDGSLTGQSLRWLSQLNEEEELGEVGIGEECALGELMEGDWKFTLMATDSDGATALDSVSFSIVSNPPLAHIISPSDGSTFTTGDTIVFIGEAIDDEGNVLNDTSLTWSSDSNGEIGTGEMFTSEILGAGTHEIRLSVERPDYGSASDSVKISIAGIPDTGQATSYTDTYGEDSDYTTHEASFTPLNSEGNEYSGVSINTEWAIMRDDVSGLTWEVKKYDNGIHKSSDEYSWDEIQSEFIDKLNEENFGGYSDWRLPTIRELGTLVDSDSYDLAIKSRFLPMQPQVIILYATPGYWSATPLPDDPDKAWILNTRFGNSLADSKTESHYVRAVRGNVLEKPDFVDNGDGTVTDLETGLMWQQGENVPMTWEEALVYCENLELAGYNDWRLPDRNELQFIVDYQEYDPAVDTAFFPGAVSSYYWSSTTYAYETDAAWVTYLYNGQLPAVYKTGSTYFRAVRGGFDGK